MFVNFTRCYHVYSNFTISVCSLIILQCHQIGLAQWVHCLTMILPLPFVVPAVSLSTKLANSAPLVLVPSLFQLLPFHSHFHHPNQHAFPQFCSRHRYSRSFSSPLQSSSVTCLAGPISATHSVATLFVSVLSFYVQDVQGSRWGNVDCRHLKVIHSRVEGVWILVHSLNMVLHKMIVQYYLFRHFHVRVWVQVVPWWNCQQLICELTDDLSLLLH
mmetsp:Transcript_13824/g.20857  ORF Transcript_13824/g.20857 Transcript_13824/m.20857 type:complete len:216 (-) Transcript_13824:130-777(-)